jgi:hypothetical protein
VILGFFMDLASDAVGTGLLVPGFGSNKGARFLSQTLNVVKDPRGPRPAFSLDLEAKTT